MAWTNLGTVAPGDVLRANSGTAAYNGVIGNFGELAPFFSAWTSWTPTLTQPGAITKTVSGAHYVQIGKLVVANFYLTVTGTGTGTNAVTVGLPVACARTALIIGSGTIFDANVTTSYSGQWFNTATTSCIFVGDWSGQNAWGVTPNLALAANDLIRGTVIYEAA
jgi:hypothetical protein